MSKMTARQRDTALGSAAIALLLNRWIEQRFTLPAPDLPTFDVPVDPEGAAEAVRQHWGLGERPIKNTIHLLESRGIRVFSLAIDASEVDAFSMWFEGRAFVFLNTRKSGERSRFDAAHELGHLVLHRHGTPNGREAEREADAFASALLMPARSVYAHAPRVATLQQLIDLKRLWMVSVSALTYRMHSLGLLSEWHYRQLFRQISARGYRTGEPNAIRREVSQVLHKVFAALREEGVTKHDIAADLQVHPTDINELVFGLVLTSLEGNAARGGRSDRPDLRIVSSNK
jgi:Zn-dependent peptidase ImmA (M78 family)